jgi:hypothetical protein
MPSSKNYKRNYKEEYDRYHASPEQRKNRAARNRARKEVEKRVGKAALRGKDVDHKRPLAKGGGNGKGNLRIQSKRANRSFKRTRNAGMK